MLKNKYLSMLLLLISASIIRFLLLPLIGKESELPLRIGIIVLIVIFGAFYVLRECAKIIEETTEVLSKKTKLAGGFLQSLGTAFPDMILGITAAVISLNLREIDYARAINYAIIAAATTFGSNIYNIGHAVWCIFRQNLADKKNSIVTMLPFSKFFGTLKPINTHIRKPKTIEMDTAIRLLTVLTILTGIVAISMVLFGLTDSGIVGLKGDLYQLTIPVGILIFIICIAVLFKFRKSQQPENLGEESVALKGFFHTHHIAYTWIALLIAGISILFVAESMVKAFEEFSVIAQIPSVLVGVAAGIIGCLGEILVVHSYSVNPKGRIGDAIVGVAMDNIVTILGAAIVAMMGGIFLGGSSLIIIFILILCLNILLVEQISILKNTISKVDQQN